MELFKKIFNKNEKGFKPNDKKTEEILEKQRDLKIIGDIKSNDFVTGLNQEIKTREIIGKDGTVANNGSWEEEKRDDELIERINKLRIDYGKLKEEIKERQIILNELRYSKNGAERSVKSLNFKGIVSKERDMITVEMMRGAEDRVERLRKKLEKGEIEIAPLYQELGEIEETLDLLTGLMKKEIPDEEKTIGNQGYDFNQN